MDFFKDENDDGVVIEDENNHQGTTEQGANLGNQNYNNMGGEMNYGQMSGDMNSGFNNMQFSGEEVDPEEKERQEARQKEETIKREKLVKKMNLEIELKQEIRNKAAEWIENSNNLYQKNIQTKREFHKNNEADFLNNRDNIKQGKTNPWDVVIGNIDLRESDYKGSKDVSRMKNVIVTRKGDFSTLKMK